MNASYVWGKLMLLIIAIEVIGFFAMCGFYAGQIRAIRDVEVSYRCGIVTMNLDGHKYIHFADGYIPSSIE